MAGLGGLLGFWNEWAIQFLVLLSLILQVALLLSAGIRRREASAMLTLLLWLAYLLADYTATYTLGHISLSKHQLAAFWAPFLLLHLGGPDNITAYSLEDSKLWLRHLLNLFWQVLGAVYVLYKYIFVSGGDSFVLGAAVLMLGVGFVKYVERTWALKRSNLDSIRGSLGEQIDRKHQHFHRSVSAKKDDEFYLRLAHSMFHRCKHAIVDSWVAKGDDDQQSSESAEMNQQSLKIQSDTKTESEKDLDIWTLTEMELSLLYDLLYTKEAMIHTWHGYCIRVASSLAVAASFLLFQISTSSKGGQEHGRFDVAVSYILLSGAFVLETTSLVRALGSSWAYAFLCNTRWSWLKHAALCRGRWYRLRWFVRAMTGRSSLHNKSPRRWSGKIGQYNMLHACSRRNRAYQSLLGRVARMLRSEGWFLRYHFSGTMEFSEDLKNQLFEYARHLTSEGGLNMQGVLRWDWGEPAFRHHEEMDLYRFLTTNMNCLGAEFQEALVIWHIATDVFIAKGRGDDSADCARLERHIRTLSNYMIFLLVDRPYMLPGLAQSMLYRRTCDNLEKQRNDNPYTHKKDVCTKLKEFFRLSDDPNSDGLMDVDDLASQLSKKAPPPSPDVPRLYFSYHVADKLHDRIKKKKKKNKDELITREDMLQLLLDVWKDFLVYAANRCSRESHAKKLSNGGELITIVWLLTDYLHHQSRKAAKDEGRRIIIK